MGRELEAGEQESRLLWKPKLWGRCACHGERGCVAGLSGALVVILAIVASFFVELCTGSLECTGRKLEAHLLRAAHAGRAESAAAAGVRASGREGAHRTSPANGWLAAEFVPVSAGHLMARELVLHAKRPGPGNIEAVEAVSRLSPGHLPLVVRLALQAAVLHHQAEGLLGYVAAFAGPASQDSSSI
ncbi:hypothetical protein DFH27DRAFT_623588 [Peziza echinospora]|nr:hypothetical protein DFH27DRAFT_623588 [Peziza echinospora]